MNTAAVGHTSDIRRRGGAEPGIDTSSCASRRLVRKTIPIPIADDLQEDK